METSYRSKLGQLLNSRLHFDQVRHEQFQPGFSARSQIVPTCRFILFTGGSVRYQVEGEDVNCEAGSVLFVPPWIWREWEVVGDRPAELLWTVFSASEGIFQDFDHLILDRPTEFFLQRLGMERILALKQRQEKYDLLMEGEMKAVLARFFLNLPELVMEKKRASDRHPEVDYSVRWLQAHYYVPTALAELQEQLTLHPDYFRDLFRRQMHESPNRYLTTLRMRAARYFLKDSVMSIKEVAARCGYTDALYFSRAYRKFWNHSPSEERK
ncbi:AraC family transcriptional regulator [Puniceicoccus vermicola]|uniref:Helix-turn-helix transcriptional regulator n=1 Tax=Puniceicoccus vermicola TaxID=388746 RepID=A0A7X1AX46_9BACT|nr:AraC family transcriptional regulator [Puniceicoccus vermicola]MBC2601616.1 helix-turn-helix transcriptional regulator [Puniceicoccus vermicola]